MRRRLRNLLLKLANGDDLYISASPRITKAEIVEIEMLTGILLQRESLYGVEPGFNPRMVYVTDAHKNQFREVVDKLLHHSPKV